MWALCVAGMAGGVLAVDGEVGKSLTFLAVFALMLALTAAWFACSRREELAADRRAVDALAGLGYDPVAVAAHTLLAPWHGPKTLRSADYLVGTHPAASTRLQAVQQRASGGGRAGCHSRSGEPARVAALAVRSMGVGTRAARRGTGTAQHWERARWLTRRAARPGPPRQRTSGPSSAQRRTRGGVPAGEPAPGRAGCVHRSAAPYDTGADDMALPPGAVRDRLGLAGVPVRWCPGWEGRWCPARGASPGCRRR